MKHYDFQAALPKRLAAQVSDPAIGEGLLETADEYGRYAALIEARGRERPIVH